MDDSKGSGYRKEINSSDRGNDTVTIDEILIFRLSSRLGGRSEVLNTPISEAFKYFELDKQEKDYGRLADYLNLWYSNPFLKGEERQAYIHSITPKVARETTETKWDYELLKQYKAKQQGG